MLDLDVWARSGYFDGTHNRDWLPGICQALHIDHNNVCRRDTRYKTFLEALNAESPFATL